MAKPRRSAAKRRPARKARARLARAVPPPDNPLLRHLGDDTIDEAEESAELKVISAGDGLRTAVALADVGARAGPPAERPRRTIAERRLNALAHARRMDGNPRGAAVAAVLGEGAGPEMVAPAPGTSNWVPMGPAAIPKGQTYSPPTRVLVTGRVTAIVVDPTDHNVIYLGAAQGGIWKTGDGGRNWSPKSDDEVSLAVGALAMDPGNHLVLYVGTGEGNFSGDSYYGGGVLATSNGGDSWANLNPGGVFTGARFCRITVTPGTPARLFAATTLGLFRSLDSGASWTQMTNGLPSGMATEVVIDPMTPTTVYSAFWAQGIYKTTNADAATPSWTKLTGGLPAGGFSRVALGISSSSPLTVYALMANSSYTIDQFYRSADGGMTWNPISLPGGNIGGQGFYNLNVAVDPTTPDIVYLSGVSLWKATRSTTTGSWSITNIGGPFHPDNHAFAFDPTNHLVVYAGSDGGIYKSTDGGMTWDDSINQGLSVTQFEFISQHPTSDAVVFGGTQDNGTEQFRNSPVFYHSDDGDGGFCAIDPNQPQNVISTYYNPSPKRSTQAGKAGSWLNVSSGITGGGLFYPPLTLDQTNPNNIAIGTDRINLDPAQGTTGWPTKVSLPGLSGNVSAIEYVNSNLIYVGTSSGQVYRLAKSGTTWSAAAIHAVPLPTSQFIWDINASPGDPNTIVLVMSGFGISHVWRGQVAATGTATWTDISGTGAGTLPDIPANALVIDPAAPNTMYVATDIAVFRTTDGGATWTQFSSGLPNCAVYDMKLHNPSRLLRVGTHGRGMWERKLDVASMPDVDLFFRNHPMHSGRVNPGPPNVPAAFEDPLQYVNLGDILNWWMCADIKVDALEGAPPSYQMNVADVDLVRYESVLQHRNARRGNVNRVYVCVHNRGIQPAAGVNVKLLYADASAGLPPLPPDFWTAFPGDSSDTSSWHPIGAAKTITSLSPTGPAILEWEWSTPASAAEHTCLLAVMDSPADPIPAANKIFDVNALVQAEKHAGLKNLHVVDAVPGTGAIVALRFHGREAAQQVIRFLPSALKGGTSAPAGWQVGIMLPTGALPQVARTTTKRARRATKAGEPSPTEMAGLAKRKPTKAMLRLLGNRRGGEHEDLDVTQVHMLENAAKGATLPGVAIPKEGFRAVLYLSAPARATAPVTFSIVQEDENGLVGGNTFVLRSVK
jgi:photosystem II stability/assembly factor-like uncharacterized protein